MTKRRGTSSDTMRITDIMMRFISVLVLVRVLARSRHKDLIHPRLYPSPQHTTATMFIPACCIVKVVDVPNQSSLYTVLPNCRQPDFIMPVTYFDSTHHT